MTTAVNEAKALLSRAKPYCEYGEDYDRGVATAAYWVADGLSRVRHKTGSIESLNVRVKELRLNLGRLASERATRAIDQHTHAEGAARALTLATWASRTI